MKRRRFRIFRFEIGAPIAYCDGSGVPGLDERKQLPLNGLVAEFKCRLFDRDRAPFGLMVSAEPHCNRTDEISGERVDAYGGELMVVLDKELVKERPFAVVNLIYEPEIARLQGVTARVDARLHGRGDNKAEARHVHRRGGQLFCANMRASISTPRPVRPSRAKLPFAAVDVAGNFRGVERGLNGHATEVPGALDLTKFSRQQGCFASNIISKWRALRRKRLHPMPAMI